jgi:hypothetical protein
MPTGRTGAGAPAAPTARAEVPLTVPGPFAHGAAGDLEGEGGAQVGLAADIYLDFDLAGTLEVFTPAALLALPGLLILASLAAQIAGGILWIPLTHRLLGGRTSSTPGSRSRPRR